LAKVPAKVIAPVVEVLGVSPVEPALKEDTEAVVAIFTKSVPFQAQTAFSPATKVTPVVGPAPRKTIDCVLPVALITIYDLLWAGAVMFRVTVPDAVHKRMASLAVLAAPVVVVSVTSASELRVVVPATAESNRDVMALFTVSPQVPDNSPVTGRAKPSNDVYAVAMFYLKLQLLPTQGFD
jgi:hypothetical protein